MQRGDREVRANQKTLRNQNLWLLCAGLEAKIQFLGEWGGVAVAT